MRILSNPVLFLSIYSFPLSIVTKRGRVFMFHQTIFYVLSLTFENLFKLVTTLYAFLGFLGRLIVEC